MAKVDKSMNIMDILAMDEGCAPIFFASGMGCLGCAAAHFENLEQACAVHGIDPDELANRLNEYFDKKENADSATGSEPEAEQVVIEQEAVAE